ncbi:MAG: hypothetical protein MK213_07585, partial [Planctomycetes bacterium]|nr:hypothetical protein [Planctomycetota bacterium]
DSFCHGLTTISSGGFSPNAASIAGYAVPGAFPNYNPVIGEWILVCFMLMAGMSFPLLWIALSRRPTAVLRDGEFRLYIFLAALFSLILVGLIPNGNPNLDTLRKGAFQCASLMSSTGYASADYNLWGDPAITALLLAMFLGGCAGSAVGGPKLLRLLLSVKFLFREMTRVLHPRAVITIRHRDAKVSERIMRAVFTVVSLYIAGYVVVGSCMVLLGAPVREGFSAALACLGNIGPAFGDLGPMGNYQGLSSAQKILLSGAMWFGRLEIVSALALFHPDLLRHIRWGHGDPHPPRA